MAGRDVTQGPIEQGIQIAAARHARQVAGIMSFDLADVLPVMAWIVEVVAH